MFTEFSSSEPENRLSSFERIRVTLDMLSEDSRIKVEVRIRKMNNFPVSLGTK